MRRRLVDGGRLILGRAVSSMHEQSGTRSAAQISFFVLLSFPAALVLVVWVFSTLFDDPSVKETIVDAIVRALPLSDTEGRDQIRKLLDEVAEGAGGLGWLSVASLMYSASGAVGGLRHTVNHALGERDRRPFFRGKLLDVAVTFIAAPALLLGLGFTLAGWLPSSVGEHIWLSGVFGRLLTDLVPLTITFVLLLAMWRFLPAIRISWRAAIIGGLTTVVGIELVQIVFRAYLDVFSDGSAVYGTLGVLLVAAFSVHFDVIAVVLGIHVAVQAHRIERAGGLTAVLAARPSDGGTPVIRTIGRFLRGLVLEKEDQDEADARKPSSPS